MTDLEIGTVFLLEGTPHQVLSSKLSHIGRGGSVMETKLRNLKSGSIVSRNFKQSDTFEEVEVEKEKIEFLYGHRGEYWFSMPNNPGKRFMLKEEQIDEIGRKFLKPKTLVEAVKVGSPSQILHGKTRGGEEILAINLPIKMDFKVIEAPPGVKGDTAQGGSKTIKIETGFELQAPLFINEGDIIRVNTQSGEYVERTEKAK